MLCCLLDELALERHDFFAVRVHARFIRCVRIVVEPTDIPLAEFLNQTFRERRIRTRFIRAARHPELREFHQRTVLIVGRAPDGGQVVDVVINPFLTM